ncbi:janus kinase and microtubule-interacting protein 3-like isoform X2 [Polistes fuscatus]|uniref:janus kinase and microtubule-interacting protein 3-like isoform X2 n=1 Tax=Polistes fuscatus TaxID=30207 RepID=UPI001CA84792|nr:janus kinase and microtubule-interacting protein 3-like isoform X2 [Polistes fuscatus]
MQNRPYEIATMTSLVAGDTVKPTNSTTTTTNGGEESSSVMIIAANDPRVQCTRKRRRLDFSTTATDIPQKTLRRNERDNNNGYDANHFLPVDSYQNSQSFKPEKKKKFNQDDDVTCDLHYFSPNQRKRPDERECQEKRRIESDTCVGNIKRKKQEQDTSVKRLVLSNNNVRDESGRLRKTIQWLEEGARRLREDLANARTELHEERRAAKLVKREIETAIREAKANEATKYQLIISELKTRLSRGSSAESNCTSPSPSLSSSSSLSSKVGLVKEDNRKREISAMKKRLVESENTIRKLKLDSLNLQGKGAPCKLDGSTCAEVRRLQTEIHALRANNDKLETKLRIATDAEKARTAELRIQHENHEAELAALRKSLRSETIKMMDEMRGKSREIEKLSKLLQTENSRKQRKTAQKDDSSMRKLQDSEKNGPIRSTSRGEKKFLVEDHTLGTYIREVGCDRAIEEIEVERLRELALEQQEVIEILRQTVKEKERKLEQLSNKKRKEEFYRQWLELEPVAEVDDEEDHEEGDSALSSAPSSLSPQPGGCGQWQGSGVTREAYEAVLIEIEELQSKLLDERQELSRAKAEVLDLEKALLQETRCSNRNKQLEELNEKLRATEEREANLLVELSELREQNELLEFRLLELEESPARKENPDHTADSGIVSPELLHPSKDQVISKQRNRAVATVIPYTNNNNYTATTRTISPVPRKPPLSLQESGIFEEEDEEGLEVELASRGTQTEIPSGELLQEVQRLQELRARIQERAAKVTNTATICSIDTPRACPALDTDVDSIVQLSSYQDRIKDLEDRLEAYEEAEERQTEERRVTKQREEELLDENYRLTERVYWLENKLHNVEELIENRSRSRSNDRRILIRDDDDDDEHEKMDNDNKQCDCQVLKSYDQPRQETKEERNKEESVTIEIMEDIFSRSKEVQTTAVIESNEDYCCPRCRIREITERTEQPEQWIAPETRRVMVEVIQNCTGEVVEEVAREAKEDENDVDEVDYASEKNENDDHVEEEEEEEEERRRTRRTRRRRVSQVAATLEENEPIDSVVTLNDELESKKKVRERQSKANRKERQDYSSTRTSKGNVRFTSEWVKRPDEYYERRHHRLILYQEICV